MSKTASTEKTRELTEDELNVVSGGTEPIVRSVDHSDLVIVKHIDAATP